jgi:hypothetical protein
MTYCYACKCGNKTERIVPLSEFAETIVCGKCNKPMGIDPVAQHGGKRDTPSNWPMESDALGVHPDQAKGYSDYLRERGVPTEIKENGNPVLTSQHHRKLLCQATQMYDRNAGYGDPTPKHNMRKKKARVRHAG